MMRMFLLLLTLSSGYRYLQVIRDHPQQDCGECRIAATSSSDRASMAIDKEKLLTPYAAMDIVRASGGYSKVIETIPCRKPLGVESSPSQQLLRLKRTACSMKSRLLRLDTKFPHN